MTNQVINKSKPFILAPMAAVNCQAFRLMCLDHGAGLVYTGMIDADELATDPEKSKKKYFDFHQKEKDHLIAQLIGGKKETLASATQILSEEKNILAIDLNAGCILGDWLGRKAGAYLLKHPNMLEKLLRTVIENSKKPVTCKIRLGWDEPNYKEISKLVENAGATAIAVHARTKKQGYMSTARWSAISEIKETVSIPVIGNGDINSPMKAKQMLGQTNCDAVMIGRWAIGNPYCFKQTADYFDSKEFPDFDNELKVALQKKEFLKFVEYYNKQPRQKMTELKQHAKWFMKGTKEKADITQEIEKCESADDLIKLFSK